MDGRVDIKWCSVDSDGQTERTEQERGGTWIGGRVVVGGSNNRGGEEWKWNASRVRRPFGAREIEECL